MPRRGCHPQPGAVWSASPGRERLQEAETRRAGRPSKVERDPGRIHLRSFGALALPEACSFPRRHPVVHPPHRSRPHAHAERRGLSMASRGAPAGGRSCDPPDDVLLARYAAGDRSAFVELVERHEAALYNFVLRQVRSPALAQDIVQDVFVRVVQGVADFKGQSRFSTWCFTIARNLCIDHARKQSLRRHPSLDQPGAPSDDGEGQTLGDRTADAHPRAAVDRAVIGDQLGDSIARAVDALPEDQREVFLLREIGQVPFKEIAEITGVPENTVKSRMRYALERLQRALAEYEGYAKALT